MLLSRLCCARLKGTVPTGANHSPGDPGSYTVGRRWKLYTHITFQKHFREQTQRYKAVLGLVRTRRTFTAEAHLNSTVPTRSRGLEDLEGSVPLSVSGFPGWNRDGRVIWCVGRIWALDLVLSPVSVTYWQEGQGRHLGTCFFNCKIKLAVPPGEP